MRGFLLRPFSSNHRFLHLDQPLRYLLLLAGLVLVVGHASAIDTKPNFIIIFVDDLGYGDLGCYGAKKIKTPNLDRMAAEGMRFSSFYTQPICGPGRAALMTGCYPMRVAEKDNEKHQAPILQVGEATIADILKPAGYATAMIGKWDLAGHTANELDFSLGPLRQGFDSYFGTPSSNDNWKQTVLVRDETIIENPIRLNESTTKRYTDESIRFIEANRARPFFLYLAPNMPHVALHCSKEFEGKSAGGTYADVVEEIDFNIGRVLEALVKNGVDKQTYVIFSSDNGPWLMKKTEGGSAGQLRSGKATTWEGGVRVAAIARAPGKIPAGMNCDRVVTTMDILPTIAAISGAELPHDRKLDGRDLSKWIHGDMPPSEDDGVYFYYLYTHLQAVRKGQWKLHLQRPARPEWLSAGLRSKPHAPDEDYFEIKEPLLFNLQLDVGERTDVAKNHPDVVHTLLDLAEKARVELGDYNRVGTGERFFEEGPKRRSNSRWLLSTPAQPH